MENRDGYMLMIDTEILVICSYTNTVDRIVRVDRYLNAGESLVQMGHT